MKPYPAALLTLTVVACCVGVVGFSGIYLWGKAYEAGRLEQSRIDYNLIKHLCETGQSFKVDTTEFTCRKNVSL